MLFPNSQELEKGMLVTYDTIVKKRIERDQRTLERKRKLQSDAVGMLRVIEKTLSLPHGNPEDPSGQSIPYVQVMVKNQNGLYERRPPHALQTNADHALLYYIAFLVDDSINGGGWEYVPIEMWYEKSQLIVVSGIERSHVVVMDDTSNDRFYEAAAMIKNSCINQLSDKRLD